MYICRGTLGDPNKHEVWLSGPISLCTPQEMRAIDTRVRRRWARRRGLETALDICTGLPCVLAAPYGPASPTPPGYVHVHGLQLESTPRSWGRLYRLRRACLSGLDVRHGWGHIPQRMLARAEYKRRREMLVCACGGPKTRLGSYSCWLDFAPPPGDRRGSSAADMSVPTFAGKKPVAYWWDRMILQPQVRCNVREGATAARYSPSGLRQCDREMESRLMLQH